MKNNPKVSVRKCTGYDCITPIIEMNLMLGNEMDDSTIDDELPSMYLDLIEEEFIELMEAVEQEDETEVIDAAGDLIVVAAGLIYALGINPNEVMKIINKSNMSKFCDTEEEAIRSVESYIEDPRYVDVHWEYNKDVGKYAIKGRKPGGSGWKGLKGVNYTTPDLTNLKKG